MDQFDGGVASQHMVTSAPNFPHAAAAEETDEPVTSHLAGFRDLLSQSGHDARNYDRYSDQQVVRIMHDEHIADGAEFPGPSRLRNQHAEGVHRDRDEAGN